MILIILSTFRDNFPIDADADAPNDATEMQIWWNDDERLRNVASKFAAEYIDRLIVFRQNQPMDVALPLLFDWHTRLKSKQRGELSDLEQIWFDFLVFAGYRIKNWFNKFSPSQYKPSHEHGKKCIKKKMIIRQAFEQELTFVCKYN
jgi:hypothetical protein